MSLFPAFEDLPPEIQQRLAASNPALATELHHTKRYQQLTRARINRIERKWEKIRKEQEKDFQMQLEYAEYLAEVGRRIFEESFAYVLKPPTYWIVEPTWLERIWAWIKNLKR